MVATVGEAGGLAAAGIATLPSDGTYFLNADLAAISDGADGAELCVRLAREAGVALIPLGAFRQTPDAATRSIGRFAFCKRDEVLDEAARRLGVWAASQRG